MTSLNANTPYIIAMPNNGAYEEQYCVNGKVVFEAEDNINGVDILETPNEIKSEGPSFLLTGTYNAILSNSTIYLINKMITPMDLKQEVFLLEGFEMSILSSVLLVQMDYLQKVLYQ